jgi:hypothetical protein
MFEITTATAKRDLLELLANNAEGKGKLVIELKSLPTFLTTPIAFTIFSYQISNYPRQIAWTSQNTIILEFLKTCQVEVVSPYQAQEEQEEVYKQEEETVFNEQEAKNYDSEPFVGFNTVEKPQTNIENQVYALTNTFKASDLLSSHRYQRSTLLEEILEENASKSEFNNVEQDKKPRVEIIENVEPKKVVQPSAKKSFEFLNTVKITSVIDPDDINNQNDQTFQEPLNIKLDQDLDNWLDRIEATRKALDNIRSVEDYKPKKKNIALRAFQFTTVSAILSIVVIGFLALFPTNVYSLDVIPEQKETETSLSLSKNQFLTQTKTVSTTSQAPATGKETISLGKARGKVTIINNSGGEIRFDRTGIIMIASNGNEYRHVPVSGEPGTFAVPARSNANNRNVTINVEASSLGDNFNLAKDQRIRILNLKRDLIGGLLIGVVTQDIVTTQETGNNVVLQENLAQAQAQAVNEVTTKAESETKLLDREDTFTESSWFEVKNINHNFSQNVGDIAPTVLVESTGSIEIYYLNSTILNEELRIKNSEVKSVKDIKSIVSEGSIIKDEVITLKVNYSYSIDLDLNKDELIQKLSDGEFNDTKNLLKRDYPVIKEIKKEEEGIRLPGIPARVNININEQEN